MVLAAHYTKVKCGVTSTVETVRFERPDRVSFRVVRGPVPHVRESFILEAADSGSTLTWEGELGTDFGLSAPSGATSSRARGKRPSASR